MFKPGDRIIPKAYRYPNGVLVVIEHCSHELRAHPDGGGFVYRFDAAKQAKYDFRLVTPDDRAEWKPGRFEIDGIPDRTFPGMWNGHAWNGFANPAFSESVAIEIAKAWTEGGYYRLEIEKGVDFCPTLKLLSNDKNLDDETITAEFHPDIPNIVDGEHLPVYFFHGWVWLEVE